MTGRTMDDALNASANHPVGRLAEVLLDKLLKGPDRDELAPNLRDRLDRIVGAGGICGRMARVRLAAEVSFLYERAPDWTRDRIVPLFDWSSPDAPAAWSARKYSSYIGSPALVQLTKRPFLDLFARPDTSEEDLLVYADWLAAILIANRTSDAGYAISPSEARSALRLAGSKVLSGFGRRLVAEMKGTEPEDKVSKWRDVVGPVFESTWPLDVQMLNCTSGV